MQTYQKACCILCFIVLAFVGQVQAQVPKFDSPADYNDYIVLEQTLIGKGIEAFNQSLAKEDFRSAKKQHTELIGLIGRSLQKIHDLPAYQGNAQFKHAAFELFTFYKMIIETDYAKIMSIAEKEGVNDKTFARISNLFVNIQRDEAVMYGAFNQAQMDFAKQFDMKITENELEKSRKERSDSLYKKEGQ